MYVEIKINYCQERRDCKVRTEIFIVYLVVGFVGSL